MTSPEDTPALARRRTGLVIAIAGGAVALVVVSVAVTAVALRGSPTAKPAAAATAAAASTTSAAAPATTAAATTAAAPSPTPGALKFGAKADFERVTATAYAFKQPVAKSATPPEQEGYEWAAADVEVCSKVDGTVVHESWRLVYADHTTIDPSSTGYRQFPLPEYPWDERPVTAGQCIRGWITYPAPKNARPVKVEYSPQGFHAEWAVA